MSHVVSDLCQIWSSEHPDGESHQWFRVWQVACPTTLCFDAAGHTFMEELMKSLSEIALLYDDWANANEVSVEKILVGLDSFADDVREHQRRRADWLTAEAIALRAKALELRTVEATMVEQLHGVSTTPKDRSWTRVSVLND